MRLPGCLLPGMHTVEDEVSVYLRIQRDRTPEYVVSRSPGFQALVRDGTGPKVLSDLTN